MRDNGFLAKYSSFVLVSKHQGRLSLTLNESLTNDYEILDASGIVSKLWREYGATALQQGLSLLDHEAITTDAASDEVVRDHFLTELFRPHSIAAMLANWLSSQIQEGEVRCVRLPVTAGNLSELSTRLSAFGKNRSFSPSWVGLLLSLPIVLAGILRLPRKKDSVIDDKSAWVAAIFGGEGTHTRHIWKWICERPGIPLLILGHQPLAPALRKVADQAGVHVVHAICLRDFPGAVIRLLRCWPELVHLHRIIENKLGVRSDLKFHTRAAAWFLRGFLHDAWIRRNCREGRYRVVFGLIAHADSRLADLAFRRLGIETVHWIHGIVEDALHFRAHSSSCLCMTPNDARIRRRHGGYKQCIGPNCDGNSNLAEIKGKGLLVMTNLIHPDNRFFRYGGPEALRWLLHIVADFDQECGPVVWRPHPRESNSPLFNEFRLLAAHLNLKIDNHTPLSIQITEFHRVVSTPSTTIGDLAAYGVIPAIFDVLPFETEGHLGRLPDEIRFGDLTGLRQVMTFLDDPNLRLRLLKSLAHEFPRSRPIPENIVTEDSQ